MGGSPWCWNTDGDPRSPQQSQLEADHGDYVAETARSRWDRFASATFEQMKTALAFLSVFNPDEFDHAMDVAQSGVRAAH